MKVEFLVAGHELESQPIERAWDMTNTEEAAEVAADDLMSHIKVDLSKNRAWKIWPGPAAGQAGGAARGMGSPEKRGKNKKPGGWGGHFPRWGRRWAFFARADKKNSSNY